MSLLGDPYAIAVDETSRDIYLSDGEQIDRVDRAGRLSRIAGTPRGPNDPFPEPVPDGAVARDTRLSVLDLAVDPTTHDLYIQNGTRLVRMSPDGIIHAFTDPANKYDFSVAYNGLGFDRNRRSLLIGDGADLERVQRLSLDLTRSPISATAGQIGKDDAFFATSDGALYIWAPKTGKVRYLGPQG